MYTFDLTDLRKAYQSVDRAAGDAFIAAFGPSGHLIPRSQTDPHLEAVAGALWLEARQLLREYALESQARDNAARAATTLGLDPNHPALQRIPLPGTN